MRYLKSLYFQVVVATLLGVLFGLLDPAHAASMKVLGDAFISLVKLVIGPVIFCTIVLGISGTGDMKKVGRVGGKALLYFEVVSTLSLIIGLCAANFLKPGHGFNVDPTKLDIGAVQSYAEKAKATTALDTVLHIIPKTFFDAFTASGDLLQILLMAVFFGYALSHVAPRAKPLRELIEGLSQVFFRIVHLVMRLAPIGAFGAMAFTVGNYGWRAFGPLLALMGTFYLSCILFVVLVLGAISWWVGFSIFSFVWYIRQELLLVLSTSSSESALVPLMEKMEKLGCTRSTTGLVIPAGYSFNLDGTNIYLTMAVLFLAQALNIDLSLGQQLSILAVAMISSKGASGVTGAGFITLAATLAAVPSIPVAGLALILGIDRFMSEARALTNIVGNGVATLVISRWENELNLDHLQAELSRHQEVLTVAKV
ncbi:MAG: C4-dicarboxylate transporter DctA [Bdellovibrionota bacterium]